MNRKLLALVAGAAFTIGCSDAPVAAAFRIVDSAGVSIATSRMPRWEAGEGWQVDSLPLLDIGAAEGPPQAQFTDIAALLLLPDGGVLVAEGSDVTLRFFDSAGKPVRTVGRSGEGPGEYRSFGDIRLAGDSLFVWDDRLRRLSVLALDGHYARGLPVQFEKGRYLFARLAGRWADGEMLYSATNGVDSRLPIGVVRDTVAVFRVSADGDRDTLLGRWPWRETMAVTWDGAVSSLPLPYQKRGTLRWSDSGFWIGTADEPRIDAFTSGGRLVRSVRWAAEAVSIGGDELRAWREKGVAPFAKETDALSTAFRAAYDKARFPDVRPSYRSFLVSVEGELLVERLRRWDAREAEAVWDVFGTDGQWFGPMTMPAGVTPSVLSGDRLLALWDDADGVTHVRVHRLVRGP